MSTALTIKPEDKTKVIALGAAATLMFGYVGISFAKNLMHSSTPPAPAPGATPAAAPSPAKAGESKPLPGTADIEEAPPLNPAKAKANKDALAAEAVDGAARQHVTLPNLNADPFQPVQGNLSQFKADGVPQKSGTQAKITPPPITLPPSVLSRINAAQKTPGTIVTESGVPMLPYIPAGGAAGGSSLGARSAAPVLPALMPDIPLVLAGVIRGEIGGNGMESGAVAMIQAGDGQQFVRIGEIIEGWRVLRIGGETVTLRRANRVRVLRMGAGAASQTTMPYLTPIRATAPPAAMGTPATPAPAATPAALVASPMPTATPAPPPLPVELSNVISSR